MNSAIRGIALLILLAIIIFIIWCFVLGKCSGRTFGMVPPRPQVGRRQNNNNEVDVSGSGSGSAGTTGSGSGSGSIIGNLVSRFQGIDTSKGVAQGGGQKAQEQQQQSECSFWDFGCKLQRFFAEGTTFFGQKPIVPEQLRSYVKPSVLRGGR